MHNRLDTISECDKGTDRPTDRISDSQIGYQHQANKPVNVIRRIRIHAKAKHYFTAVWQQVKNETILQRICIFFSADNHAHAGVNKRVDNLIDWLIFIKVHVTNVHAQTVMTRWQNNISKNAHTQTSQTNRQLKAVKWI